MDNWSFCEASVFLKYYMKVTQYSIIMLPLKFQAKVMMKNANLLPKLQEILSNLNNLQSTPEKCVQDLTSVLITVSEWIDFWYI